MVEAPADDKDLSPMDGIEISSLSAPPRAAIIGAMSEQTMRAIQQTELGGPEVLNWSRCRGRGPSRLKSWSGCVPPDRPRRLEVAQPRAAGR